MFLFLILIYWGGWASVMQCDMSFYRSPFEMNAEFIPVIGQLVKLYVIFV